MVSPPDAGTAAHTELPLRLIRAIALRAQLLDDSVELSSGKEGVAQTIEHLGYVQIDTIAVVERAHHHTLWTRRSGYTPGMMMFWRGELMITERRNFQRVYDLTERVLPSETDTRVPDDEELGRFFVRRALNAHGVARENEIYEHIPATGRQTIATALRGLQEEGDVAAVRVPELGNDLYYTMADTLERNEARGGAAQSDVILLSPFDNLIILRVRTQRLFAFDYALECYLPKSKRKYGYFTLPILWGTDMVGRLDPAADRKRRILIMRSLIFEPTFRESDAFLSAFSSKLVAFARFNGCGGIEVGRISPSGLKRALTRSLKQAWSKV